MASRDNVLHERFFNCLISGDRPGVREVIDQVLNVECGGERIISHLFWPTLVHVQDLYRHDQLSDLGFHFATRLLRQLVDQMQLRLSQQPRNGQRVLVVCGAEQSEELAAQMTSDLLEAAGFTVHYAGGGVANDEIVEQIGTAEIHKIVVFGATPAAVPQTRLLIDRLHEIGACPHVQIIVGGGVFNRADGLAEEIGADLWGEEPGEIVEAILDEPDRRMTADQRTVGRKRRPVKRDAA